MGIRNIIYNVDTFGSEPKSIMWGGVQNEDNATEIIYSLSPDLVSEIGANGLVRIDFFSASAGYDPSENLEIADYSVRRLIPKKFTQYGGEMTVTLNITKEDSEVIEIPATVFFTANRREDNRLISNISRYEEHIGYLTDVIRGDIANFEQELEAIDLDNYITLDEAEVILAKNSADEVIADGVILNGGGAENVVQGTLTDNQAYDISFFSALNAKWLNENGYGSEKVKMGRIAQNGEISAGGIRIYSEGGYIKIQRPSPTTGDIIFLTKTEFIDVREVGA